MLNIKSSDRSDWACQKTKIHSEKRRRINWTFQSEMLLLSYHQFLIKITIIKLCFICSFANFREKKIASTGKPLKSKLVRAETCSSFNLFRLSKKYTEMLEGVWFGVRRVRIP